MQKLQYLYDSRPKLRGMQRHLAHLGAEGWELVAVIAPHTEGGKYRFIYKRPDETGSVPPSEREEDDQ
jgi:hypothetical protein